MLVWVVVRRQLERPTIHHKPLMMHELTPL